MGKAVSTKQNFISLYTEHLKHGQNSWYTQMWAMDSARLETSTPGEFRYGRNGRSPFHPWAQEAEKYGTKPRNALIRTKGAGNHCKPQQMTWGSMTNLSKSI